VCQVLLRERGPAVADLQRETVVQPGGDDPEEDGQRLFQTSDRDRHVRIVHAARRRRRPTAVVPGLARQRPGAAVLLEAVLRPRGRQRYGVRRPEQPVHGDRRQHVHMSERVPGRVRQRWPRRRRRQRRQRRRRQQRADILLYQRIVRGRLRQVGPNRVSRGLTTAMAILCRACKYVF